MLNLLGFTQMFLQVAGDVSQCAVIVTEAKICSRINAQHRHYLIIS